MSMFSYPTELSADAMKKQMDAMSGWMQGTDLNVPPLMTHPAGAIAAATMLGFGIAGHMTGLMFGAMQSAMTMPARAFAMADMLAEPAEAAIDAASTEMSAEVVSLKRTATKAVKMADAAVAAPKKAVKDPAEAPAKAAVKAVADAAAVTGSAASRAAVTGAAVDKLKSDADMAAAASLETVVADKPGAPAQSKALLEPEDFRRPAEMAAPAKPDDLKAISGVGPKLEQVLNGLGIWTYGQIAAWGEEEVAWLDDYLQFKGRIDRDEWIKQAADFAKAGKA